MCQKGKRMLKDGQISDEESVANTFADLKTLSTVEKHQTKVLRYAMLGNCSQGSFIQELLVKKIQTSGRKTTLDLKTLNDERSDPTITIDRLQVAGEKDDNT